MTNSKVTEESRHQGRLSCGVAKYHKWPSEKVTLHDLCTSPKMSLWSAWEMHSYSIQIKQSIPARKRDLVIMSSGMTLMRNYRQRMMALSESLGAFPLNSEDVQLTVGIWPCFWP